MHLTTVLLAAVLVATTSAAAQGSDPDLARDLAATCANCHGTNGVSRGGTATLAGQSRDDIVRAMQGYKSGAKTGTIMPQLAKGYSDAEIELAAGQRKKTTPALFPLISRALWTAARIASGVETMN